MGRPPMPLGTYGKVLYLPTPSGRVMARVKIRDWDGRVRLVTKTRASQAAAERALKEELATTMEVRVGRRPAWLVYVTVA